MLSRRRLLIASTAAALSVPVLTKVLGSTASAATPTTLPLDLANGTTSSPSRKSGEAKVTTDAAPGP